MEPGQSVGQYTLVRFLGKGGMAEVWEARHSYLANKGRLAIKFLLPQFAANKELQERFLREAQRQLEHPYIISATDFFQVDGLSFMVMRYVPPPGNRPESMDEKPRSLEDRLEEDHPLSLEEIHTFACDVLSALDFAHSQGVVHRDVKPANVLLHRNGHAMLTDFGIAKGLREERSMTRIGTSMGTPDYMSPEQIRAPQNVDARSDVYSFGCVLYAMLSRYPPFGDEETTEYEIKDRHVRVTPPPLVYWNRKIPPAVGKVVFKCLEKDPAKRYQSCQEVMLALDAALYPKRSEIETLPLEDFSVPVQPPQPFQERGPEPERVILPKGETHPPVVSPPAEKPMKREDPPLPPETTPASRTRTYILAAGAVVVLLVGVGLVWWSQHGKSPDPPAVDWAKLPYNDSRLAECKDEPACAARKAQADALLATDWTNVRFDSPLFDDCMGFPTCISRKAESDALKAVTQWASADKHLLADCMQNAQCNQERLRRGKAESPTVPNPNNPPGDAEGWPDCCRDSSNVALCKKQKKAAGVYDCPTGQ